MTAWLTGLLASIIRPIIQEELQSFKDAFIKEFKTVVGINKEGKKARELKEELKNANTDEERKAIREKIFDYFDSIDDFVDSV